MNNKPLKPYLIRAIFEWCTDSGLTPHIVVFVDENTQVPTQYVQDNEIVLNISMNSCQNLILGDEWITFTARFSGVVYDIKIPVGHVISIYARENAEGMGFEVEKYQAPPEVLISEEIKKTVTKKTTKQTVPSHLKIVKKTD